MSVQKGQNLGGVRTIDDLRDRSVIDAITGCWNVRGVNKRSGCQLWLPALQQAVSLTGAMSVLITGEKAAPGTCWYAACRNPRCGNPEHRKFGTLSDAQRELRDGNSQIARQRIARAMRAKSKVFSPELRAEIMSSPESAAAIARRVSSLPIRGTYPSKPPLAGL